MDIVGARMGEKYIARTSVVRRRVACGGRAITTRGRLRINGARRGEKYFNRTSVVRWRVAGAPPQCVGDGASLAHQSRTHGRKIFRPYKCGAWLHWAGATIWGAAMFDGWVMVD